MTHYDTVNSPGRIFIDHGQITISIKDKSMVIYHCRGPFNLEAFKTMEGIRSKVIKELGEEIKNWVDVIIYEESCLATTEMLAELASYQKRLKSSNISPLTSAFVFKKDVEGSQIMPDEYKKCYDSAKVSFRAFDNEPDAMEYVRTYLPKG